MLEAQNDCRSALNSLGFWGFCLLAYNVAVQHAADHLLCRTAKESLRSALQILSQQSTIAHCSLGHARGARVKFDARLEFRRRNASAKQVEGTRAEEAGDFGYVPGSGVGGFLSLRHDTQTRSRPFSHIHYSKVGALRRRIRRRTWSSTEKRGVSKLCLSFWSHVADSFEPILPPFCPLFALCLPLSVSLGSLSAHKHPAPRTNIVSVSNRSLLPQGLAEEHGNSDPDFASHYRHVIRPPSAMAYGYGTHRRSHTFDASCCSFLFHSPLTCTGSLVPL